VRRVLGWRSAERHDGVVARALAFSAKPALRHPDERMEPVEGAHESGNELSEGVVPRDVRELVTQHDATVRLGPIECVFGDKNYGSARSPG
jgi:hypothetical protein